MGLRIILIFGAVMTVVAGVGCGSFGNNGTTDSLESEVSTDRQYLLERVGDVAIVQVYADGFERLELREKILVWHLYQAALAGRDIYYDQRYAHNLEMREIFEQILIHSDDIDPETFNAIERYAKLFWINTGPFNNITARKFVLETSPEAFADSVRAADSRGATFPVHDGENLEEMIIRTEPLFFDSEFESIVTNKTPGEGQDILLSSSNNLYEDVSMLDVENFNEEYPLNSRLVKRDGELIEEVYRVDGRYGKEISEIIEHLENAVPFATESMAKAIKALIRWYQTGTVTDRRAYDIAWVADQDSPVDTINGFTEVYMDARGVKGAWEALVFYVNPEKTKTISLLADQAQWFEDHMPWDPDYRREGVRGITANAIDVVVETGDSGPVTPIGINLPNDQNVREEYGSKSVSLSNVLDAYDQSRPPSYRREFTWTEEEALRAEKWGRFAGELSTNMHEVIGHASGRVADRLEGNPQAFLKEQYSALEEARADLVALYFIADTKLVELGVVQAEDHEDIIKTHYEGYARNAILQLRRVREGSQLEEDHMRNRQMIVNWLIDNTEAIEVRERDDKTFYVMTNLGKYRDGVGQLLAEVQRIKSEGDYDAAKQLFENYGIHFDPTLRDQVVERVSRVDLPSYSGFVMPKLEPVVGDEGKILDVMITYPKDFTQQMLEYSGKR